MIVTLEPRILMTTSTVVFNPANGDQLVTVVDDTDLAATPIMVTVNGGSPVVGNQVRISHAAQQDSNDLREVFVVDTNGYLRAVHLDSDQPALQQDPFGGSVVLGPTMVLSDGVGGSIFALSPQIQAIDVVTPSSPNGDIVLNMSGTIRSASGPIAGLSVTWTVTIPNTTPIVASASGATTVRIEQQAHFATGVTLSPTAEANAEAFRVVRFSNSYVDAPQTSMNTTSHDADTALAYGPDGSLLSELDLGSVPRGALLASGGVAGTTSIRLEQRRPSLLNDDPPNLTLRLIDPVNPNQYQAQGFISNDDVDENSDNVDWYINQQFASSTIPAGTDLSWTLELTAEDGGDLLPQARFLHEQARQYTRSANPSDFGQPMIPIFTNANDRGMYLADIFHGGVTDDATDPDAFRGRSSYRMTIDQLGGGGFVVFEMGNSRPRDIPEIGFAHRLRFAAKGDTNGQQFEVRMQRADGSLVDLGAARTVTLSNTWSEYDIALPPSLEASDVKNVHFVFLPSLPQGMGTVRLDEIRLSTDGFDPLRVLQSYVPLDAGGNIRDDAFYHQAAFIYDNALAIKVLLVSGDPESRQLARDIADAILMTQLPDGSFYDQLNSGHVAEAGGVRESFGERRAGDNLFLGLSLLEMARASPTDTRYYDAAVSIGNWLDSNLRAAGTLGGYYGGLDASGQLLTYRSTEHNVDAFEFYRQLADLASLFGDVASAPVWREHATHAGTFVIQMFDNDIDVAKRKFWTGTQEGLDDINTSSVPGDVQFWAQQTLGQSAEFGGSVGYEEAIDWAIANLSATDGPLIGVNFSTGAQAESPNHVWLEGTAHAAVSFALSGPPRDAIRETSLETLRLARLTGVGNSGNPHNGLGVPASSRDTIVDSSFEFLAFDDRLHVGASAWAFFATKGISPFQQLLSVAPVINSFDGTVNYTENGAAVLLDTNATVTDADSADFNAGQLTVSLIVNAESTDRVQIRHQGTAAGQIGVSGTNVTFGGTVIGSFTGGTGTTALVVTLNASATPAAVQALLLNVTYRNVSDNPSTAPRTVRVSLTDGDGGLSNLPTKTISVTAVNDAPLIGAFDTTVNYTENGLAVLDTNAAVGDADSANFDTGTLTVQLTVSAEAPDRLEIRHQGTAAGQIGVSGTNVTFGGTVIGSFTGGTGTTALVVTLNASATPAAVQALLRNVTYRNVSDNPSTLARTVRVSLTDGDGGTSNLPTKTINVAAVNDAPLIGAFDTTVNYTENGLAVLDTNAAVGDVDSANFDTGKLTVHLTVNAEAADRLEIRHQGTAAGQIGVSGTNVTFGGTTIGSFTGGAGATALMVTLNASATPAAAQALLRNVAYRNVSDNPSTLARTVRVSLTDGDGGTSNLPTKTINVAAVNDAPLIGAFDTTVNYTEGGLAVLDSNAAVGDADSANFDTGTLTVHLTVNAEAADHLEIRNQGTAAGQIGVSGTNVTFGGTVIGSFTGGVGTTALVVTLNASATPAAVQALLRNVTYRNVSNNPSTAPRTVRVTLTDGDGGTSNQPTKTINVAAINNASVPTARYSGRGAFDFYVPSLAYADDSPGRRKRRRSF